MQSAGISNRTYNLAAPGGYDAGVANGPFTYREGNFTGLEGQNIVALNGVSLSTGALVRNDPSLNATDFGFSPNRTPQQNLASLKLAFAAAEVGSEVLVPPALKRYLVDYTGGLSAAAVIDKRLTLRIDGDIQAYYAVGGNPAPAPIGPNPAYMLRITSPGVTITGNGRIFGDGTINDVNAGTDDTMPGLIRVEADRFTFSGVTIDTPPKIGIHLYGCKGARIGGTFMGGPLKYSDTAYFQVRATGGSGHYFGFRLAKSANGGRTVQGVFLNGVNGCTYNIQAEPGSFYEKAVYGFGDNHSFVGGTIYGDTGIVPGTNLQGCVTLPIRFHGSNNSVSNVTTVGCAGGAQLMDGVGNSVDNCRFLNCGQTGVSIYNSSLTNTRVTNTVVTVGNLAGFLISSGIYVAANAGSRNLTIDGNTVSGFSVDDPLINIAPWSANTAFPKTAAIKPRVANGRYYVQTVTDGISGATEPAWPTTPGATVNDGSNVWVTLAYEANQSEIRVLGASAGAGAITHSRICNNITAGGRNGVYTRLVAYSKIAGNKVDCSLWGLSENSGSFNAWEFNDVTGTSNTGVQTISQTSTFLNYRMAAWAPSQGAGLTVAGAFSSSGSYEQIGRAVHYRGEVRGADSIQMATGGKLSDVPVTPARMAAGSVLTNSLSGGNCGVLQGADAGALYSTATAVSGVISFSITYEAQM